MKISGKHLAGLLGVAPATLSLAVTNGHYCRDHPVGNWAVVSESGRVTAYEVPPDVWTALNGSGEASRANPPVCQPDGVRTTGILRPSLSNESSPEAASLPPEDYFRPTAAASGAVVLTKALELDNDVSKAVIVSGAGIIGALIGQESGGGPAALLGSFLGAGVAAWAMGLLNLKPQPAATLQHAPRSAGVSSRFLTVTTIG